MIKKDDFKALMTDDEILDGLMSGVYIIYARMYLSTRGDDHREAVKFFNSELFKSRFGDKAPEIIEELKRKRKNGEKLHVKKRSNSYTTADDELLHGNKNV